MPPRKRSVEEIVELVAPDLSPEQHEHFRQGVALFNKGKHWHAHESWEAAWLPMGEGASDNAEIIIRALIQVASGIHLKRTGRYKGARHHFEKALPKLRLAPPWFMDIDIVAVRLFAEHQLRHFDQNISFTIRLR